MNVLPVCMQQWTVRCCWVWWRLILYLGKVNNKHCSYSARRWLDCELSGATPCYVSIGYKWNWSICPPLEPSPGCEQALQLLMWQITTKDLVVFYALIMAALCNRGAIIFLPCSFFLLSSSFFLSSPNLSGRRLDVCHTSTHGVARVQI